MIYVRHKKAPIKEYYYSFSISLALLMADVIKPVGIARKPKPIIKTKNVHLEPLADDYLKSNDHFLIYPFAGDH